MYDFAVEDCLYHPSCKNVSIGILENIKNQKMFLPTNEVSRKFLLNLGLALKI